MTRLEPDDLDADPILELERWLRAAADAGHAEPGAMTVATAGRDGRPSARIVLLRGLDQRGLVFYTNRDSEKGRALAENPYAALVFYWDRLGRQVRATGMVEELMRVESAAYFATRPAGSRRAAWASPQSRVLPGGLPELEALFAAAEKRFAGDEIPLPPFWGGYRVVPEAFEFWLSQPSRLHDRISYRREPAGGWRRERLAP